ncbi:ABC transporter substrate-binding protein [Salinarimonas sp.]|uniref:ABC transporter substrate-binding protein n=1 Tax=Salinarimonas sp. TaxID=2766526 RepID=UPI0032D92710
MKRIPAALAGLLLAAAATAPAQAADELTVLLDWFANPDHAPLVVAQEMGYFDAADLDVTLIEPADPSAPPRLVASGQGDIAISYQPSLYLHVAEELPLVRIGTLVSTPLNSLVTLADGPVETLADLKGATIGYSIAGFEEALLSTMLAQADLTLDDVSLVNVNFALTPALLSGQVDAVIGAFRNFELTELALQGSEGRAFYPEEHGVPTYDELIYVVRRDRADEAVFARFLDAIEQATVHLLNHPEESWEAFVAAYPRADDALNRQAWTDTLRRFQASPAAVDPERYARFATFMKERGLIDEVAPLERYIGATR